MTNIEKKIDGIKWLPWIGIKYFSCPPKYKLLIVGESHYHDNSSESIEKHNKESFTQEVVQDLAVNRNYYNTKMFKNLHLALCDHDDFQSDKLWELISFYNFIQRPMVTNKERPSKEDHLKAWAVFFELIDKLKPAKVLFIGVEASNYLSLYRRDIKVTKETKIGTTSPRSAKIDVAYQEDPLELYFIKHTSQYFSSEKWHQYLLEKLGGFIRWITPQVS